ncbi:NADH-ubiquinone oxidoreductase B12 subunit family-domain-containing protein [Spinellus fusiger]|nr:NADH-ubiquinone oxidoreductase B12 subunit family-domain-containing protein [Spinellus fusiger]
MTPKFTHSEANHTKPVYHDPWAKREAWRRHSFFVKTNSVRSIFPGLGLATVAFAAYCGYEAIFLKDKKHH